MKNFEEFSKIISVNESEVEMIAEDLAYYEKEGYIEDKSVTDEKTLLALVEDNITKAWDDFCKKKGISYGEGKIEVEPGNRGTYINLKAKPIDPRDMGVFAHALKTAKLSFFGGKKIGSADVEGKFLFQPRIWCTLNISYESKSGGTNGLDYEVDVVNGYPNSSIDYHILDKTWYTDKEYFEKYHPRK